jgi:uroporphyrinogen III methyltransferase/synthase
VVRLKGGDTAIFARTAEEVEQLAAQAVPFEIVPGITAGLAVTAYAGIPLTHRDWASAVAFVTGQLQPSDGSNEADDGIDWKALAQFPGTLVLYMGVTTAKHWSQRLIESGRSPKTPVALVRRVSWPDQQVIRCKLDNVSETIRSLPGFRPPVISIVGEVVNLAATMNWFSQRPLFGKRYLVAATHDSGSKLSRRLSELGSQVTLQPAMETVPTDNWTEIDPHLHGLSRYSWIVFTSPVGVDIFMNRLFHLGYDARHLSRSKIASVGTATSETLQRYSLRADRTPQITGIEYLAPLLAPESPGASILFVRNEAGRTEGIELLASLGAECVSIHVYEQRPVPVWPSATLEASREGNWDGILVTSANIAQRACDLLAPHGIHQRWYSISERATDILKSKCCTQVVTATSPNLDSLVDAVVRDVNARD